MTPGEVCRYAASRARVRKCEIQERVSCDYVLATLIVKGVAITLGSKETYPSLEEAYPGVFDDIAQVKSEAIHEQKINLSALRFKQFAQSYNRRFQDKEVPKTINE
jgi:hypothetical protein